MFRSILLFLLFTFLFFSAQAQTWVSFTQNRSRFPVVSPFGTMQTHFVGLQMDSLLLQNKDYDYFLEKAGFRGKSADAPQCFELVFMRRNGDRSNPKAANFQEKTCCTSISVALYVFDIRSPKKPSARYSATINNLPNTDDGKTIRCQIPFSTPLDGNLAFVLKTEGTFDRLNVGKHKAPKLIESDWLADESEPVFIYAPVAGFEDYSNTVGEAMETPAEGPRQKFTQKTNRPAFRTGDVPNAYGYPVPAELLEWSIKGSNYARAYSENGKQGMKASDGTILIKAEYDYIHFEYSGFMLASKEGKMGVINEANAVVIPFEYKQLDLIYVNRGSQIPKGVPLESLRLLAKKEDGSVGILSGEGEIIAPFRQTRMAHLHYFYDAPRRDNGWILETPKDYGKIVRETAILYRFEHAGAIDGNGKILLPFEYDDIDVFSYSDNPALVQVTKNGKSGLFDLHGKMLIEPSFTSDFTAVGSLDLSKKGTFPRYFRNSMVVETGEYGIEINKAGIIDSIGNIILPFEYDAVGQALQVDDALYFSAKKQGKWGMVDRTGAVKIPFEYGEIRQAFELEGQVVLKVNDTLKQSSGLLNLDNKLLLPFGHFIGLTSNGKTLTFQDENKLWGLIDGKGNVLHAPLFASLGFLESGYLSYAENGLFGLLDPYGKKLTEPIYQTVHANPDFLVYLKAGLRDKGIALDDVVAQLKKDDRYSVFLKDGRLVQVE